MVRGVTLGGLCTQNVMLPSGFHWKELQAQERVKGEGQAGEWSSILPGRELRCPATTALAARPVSDTFWMSQPSHLQWM